MTEDKTARVISSKYGGVVKGMYCPECHSITTFTEWLNRPYGYLSGVVCDTCQSDIRQKEPSYYYCHVYREKCVCGYEQIVTTQDDRNPEYYSTVGVPCPKCGTLIIFLLPVN